MGLTALEPYQYPTLPSVRSIEIERLWRSKGTGSKISIFDLPGAACHPSTTTVLGGICFLYPQEEEMIRGGRIRFVDENGFEAWFRSWFPRLDQIHNTVGVPPQSTREVVITCEDHLFAKRVARWTKANEKSDTPALDPAKLTQIFKTAQREAGEPTIRNWLCQNGYRGKVNFVYTSEIQSQLEATVRAWDLVSSLGFGKQFDTACVEIMYTGFYPYCVLGLKGDIVIYEPNNHYGLNTERLPSLAEWAARNPYGTRGGINESVGFIGYEEFADSDSPTRQRLGYMQVPNAGNYQSFVASPKDTIAYIRNLYPRRDTRGWSNANLNEMLRRDLLDIYGGT